MARADDQIDSQDLSSTLARRFRVQALACIYLGSNLYGGLMDRAADDIEQGGPLRRVMRGFESEPGHYGLALRFFGAVHRLVLAGQAPDLARFYPSAGGTEIAGSGGEKAWPSFLAVVEAHEKFCRTTLRQPPQTNEVGRAAALIPGFLMAYRQTGLPLRLLEVGASAGLNLHWDAFCYQNTDGRLIGDPDSPVRFPANWYPDGMEWFLASSPGSSEFDLPPIESRQGCDSSPVDVNGEEGARVLSSYVWPDQSERFDRLQGAISIARRARVSVNKSHACEWLTRRLAHHARDICTVVFHSIFLQYLSINDRDALTTSIQEAGHRATIESPIAWLRMEPATLNPGGRPPSWPAELAQVRLTVWPGGAESVIAGAGFHGSPVRPPS